MAEEEKGILDISTKTIWGLAALAGLGVGAYLFWRNYNKRKAEGSSSAAPAVITVPVAPLKKPKQPRKK